MKKFQNLRKNQHDLTASCKKTQILLKLIVLKICFNVKFGVISSSFDMCIYSKMSKVNFNKVRVISIESSANKRKQLDKNVKQQNTNTANKNKSNENTQ